MILLPLWTRIEFLSIAPKAAALPRSQTNQNIWLFFLRNIYK